MWKYPYYILSSSFKNKSVPDQEANCCVIIDMNQIIHFTLQILLSWRLTNE